MVKKLVSKHMNEINIPNQSDSKDLSGRDLYNATLPFIEEIVVKSWFAVISTFLILSILLLLAIICPWWPAQILASILAGLCMVRGFAIYHDYMHGSILRDSWLAKIIFYSYSVLMLTPPSSWRKGHNYHHAHVGKTSESKYGSFPTITTDIWDGMSLYEKFKYRFIRSPLVIIFGYITVFLFTLCIEPLIENLQKHWDSIVVILFHFGLLFCLYYFFGLSGAIYGCILPFWIASTIGSYLFYVQHNWEDAQYLSDDKWNYYDAALVSSSYIKLGAIMKWFTANIGYHHVHHLNSKIPFYRLPEAMANIPELQNPSTITIYPSDILSSLRLKLWDIHSKRMVAFKKL